MRTFNLKYKAITTTTLIVFLTLTLAAQKPNMQGQNRGHGLNMLPDITEDQKEQISTLRTQQVQKMTQLRAEIGVLQAQLKVLSVAEKTDQKAIDSKIDELFKAKATVAKERSRHKQKVREILTAEQRAIFDAHSGKRHAKAKHHHKQGQGQMQGHGKKQHQQRSQQRNYQSRG